MNVCIPTNTNFGLQSEIAPNFGQALWFMVIDSDTMETVAVDASDTAQRDKPINMDAILCKGMSEKLYVTLRGQGLPIYGTRARNVAEAMADFFEGELRDLADYSCCGGSNPDCDSKHVDGSLSS